MFTDFPPVRGRTLAWQPFLAMHVQTVCMRPSVIHYDSLYTAVMGLYDTKMTLAFRGNSGRIGGAVPSRVFSGSGSDESQVWAEVEEALSGLVTKRHREKLQQDTLTAMHGYLEALSLDVSKLSVVHIAGTKGKGSTSTMVEAMLRQKGYRTGLFTSPHLVDVRERIRIDGQILPVDEFAGHFWSVHAKLRGSGEPMPGYFRFLTCLAFDVFCKSNLDVVVLEVPPLCFPLLCPSHFSETSGAHLRSGSEVASTPQMWSLIRLCAG